MSTANGKQQESERNPRSSFLVRINSGQIALVFCFLLLVSSFPALAHAAVFQQPGSAPASPARPIELSPAARAWVDAAVDALGRGALNDAERAARAAVSAAPRSPIPHNVLGVVTEEARPSEVTLRRGGPPPALSGVEGQPPRAASN